MPVGGCLLFGEEMPWRRLAGIGVAMTGIVWYSMLKLQEGAAAAQHLLPSTANGAAVALQCLMQYCARAFVPESSPRTSTGCGVPRRRCSAAHGSCAHLAARTRVLGCNDKTCVMFGLGSASAFVSHLLPKSYHQVSVCTEPLWHLQSSSSVPKMRRCVQWQILLGNKPQLSKQLGKTHTSDLASTKLRSTTAPADKLAADQLGAQVI